MITFSQVVFEVWIIPTLVIKIYAVAKNDKAANRCAKAPNGFSQHFNSWIFLIKPAIKKRQ
jgi:hypothetical protein